MLRVLRQGLNSSHSVITDNLDAGLSTHVLYLRLVLHYWLLFITEDITSFQQPTYILR